MALSTPAIRALVVDDERPARQHAIRLLKSHTDVTVVGECADGEDAVRVLRSTPVELVLLDIQMPALDGFEVIATIGAAKMPAIVFMSAYSEFAVRAFEAYAVDYLLKPFDAKRLDIALERAREEIARRKERSNSDERLPALLAHVRAGESDRYPESIAIRSGASYVVTRVADIDWVQADGNYARVYVQKRPRLLTKSLAVLEKEVLDPAVFVRVHRSSIVNTNKIATLEPESHGDLLLTLLDGTRVQCSRRYRKKLEGRLYFTS